MQDDLVDRSPCPIQESPWTNSYRIFANGAKKAFVGLAVLLRQPFRLWKRYNADEVYEQSGNCKEQCANKNILEVSGWKILMDDQSDFDKSCSSEAKEQWKIDARPFPDDQKCCRQQKGDENQKLKRRQFQSVCLPKTIVLLPRGLALLI